MEYIVITNRKNNLQVRGVRVYATEFDEHYKMKSTFLFDDRKYPECSLLSNEYILKALVVNDILFVVIKSM